MLWLCFKLPSCLFGNTRDTFVMHEKAKFVCFNYMQPQKVKIKSVQINMKHVSYKDISCLKTLRCCINPAYKMINNCWHFNIYEQNKFHEQDKFHAQLSRACKMFSNLEACTSYTQ